MIQAGSVLRICSKGPSALGRTFGYYKSLELTPSLLCFLLLAISLSRAEAVPPKGAGRSDGPKPSATIEPAAQARSLAMLWQVIMQLEHHVRKKDLAAIHNEDLILSAAAAELLAEAESIAPRKTKDFRSSLTILCSRVSALHLVADLNQQDK